MSGARTDRATARAAPAAGFRRAPPAAGWEQRCSALFEDLRKPARVMIRRAYGAALSEEEIDDVYASAWASTLAALRGREARMSDSDLRSYLLTAVAGHASKEMRRRSRRPTTALEDGHAQVLADAHQPAPEERAVAAEDGSVARDLLSSLPPRRRAVMLLRYGCGLEPKEVCSRVANLSPRAYRKEITRGVEELIARLREVESGEWCESREPILRDYVAGVASEEERRQAQSHLGHCRRCADLVARLSEQLNDLGSAPALAALAAAGSEAPTVGERLAAALGRGRDAVGEGGAAAGDAAAGLSGAGGTRGAGVAGAGALAKLAGIGAAGKAAVACLGAGAAATACVAAGLVPGTGADRGPAAAGADRGAATVRESPPDPTPAPVPAPTLDAIQTVGPAPGAGGGPDPSPAPGPEPVADAVEVEAAPDGAPALSPAPTAPPAEQEFGLPAAAAASGSPARVVGGGGGRGGGASGAEVAREFGP